MPFRGKRKNHNGSYFCLAAPHQPKLCPTASWAVQGIIVANNSAVGSSPRSVFVDQNNTLYALDAIDYRVLIWPQGSRIPTRILFGGLRYPLSLFVTANGDVYVDNGINGRVDKWEPNATSSVVAMFVTGQCSGLFVDTNNGVYCSMSAYHRVVKNSLNGGVNTVISVAGNGSIGATSTTLWNPEGIFVDLSFNLYVADYGNHRIQMFRSGQLNATTVAGTGTTGPFSLSYPTSFVVDRDGYLFIVDRSNHRVIGSSANGFRCLIGCSGSSGSSLDRLINPQSLAFDNVGNIYVNDQGNSRIVQFTLGRNVCGESVALRFCHRNEFSKHTMFDCLHACRQSEKLLFSEKDEST